jgi:hypothetical protein
MEPATRARCPVVGRVVLSDVDLREPRFWPVTGACPITHDLPGSSADPWKIPNRVLLQSVAADHS